MQHFFNNLPPKIRFCFAVFGVVLLIAALFWFAFFFVLDRVRSASAEIEAAKISRASIEVRRIEAKREETTLLELHDDVSRADEMFVEQPLVFFEFLEDLARRNNLIILLALEGQGGDGVSPERLRVSVDGAYRSLLRFIRGIESAPYAIEIGAMTLTISNQQVPFFDSRARLSVDLRIISR